MALFGGKKKTDEAKAEGAVAASGAVSSQGIAHILRHARITEKATMHSQQGVYVFDVADNASKKEIAAAVKKIYSVTPRMVRVAPVPTKLKRNMRTGRVGVRTGGKKAYIYLKKGDTINI
jgi:large subunit ribosomal protein L23